MPLEAFLLRILVAMLVGTIIGLERQLTHHPAGLRTNALVSLGACLFVSLQSQFLSNNIVIPIAAQVVTGVGFLGAGLIMREGLNVKGMNTAATIWCSAALGSLAGAGYWGDSLIACLAVLILNSGYLPLVRFLERRTALSVTVSSSYQAIVTCRRPVEAAIRAIIVRDVGVETNATLRGMSVRDDKDMQQVIITADVFTPTRNDAFLESLTLRLGVEDSVLAVSWHREG
jgi:putative Mg2+ transporter-C (MgtC) family protein